MVSFPPTRSPNEDYPEPTDEADARASKTGFKAARRNQWLPYLHEALSPEEAIELVDWVRTALVSPAAARRNAGGLLGLMQVTGLPLELVLSSPVSDASSNSAFTPEGTWRKKILREPRAWTAQLAQLPLLRRWTNRVTFDMPIELKRWLRAVTRGGMHTTLSHALKLDLKTADTMVREALQIVRTQRGGHQTLGRVQHWLSMAVHRASHDHVVAHLVAATPADPPQASAYYRAYPSTSLESVHRQALDSAGWRFDDVQAGRNDVDAWVGSQLNPEPESMR